MITAIGSMVIIKVEYADKINTIFVPDQAKNLSGDYLGIVVSVGPEYPDRRLKPGDKVMFMRNEGFKIKPYFGDWKDEYFAVKQRWVGAKCN